jgi:carbon starvation protein
MHPLLIAALAGVGFIAAYHTYGRWLGRRIFQLSASAVCPSIRLNDGKDYVPTPKSVVFGHHFTSIAGTGPIVGPAIAVMWGWLPALLWVVFGSIFIGAVHDLGALVVSLRNNGQTVGDIAGRVIHPRVRVLFLLILFMALTIVLAVFGLVIANVFKLYPQSIFPCLVQIPVAVVIGLWLHRKGVGLLLPSIVALTIMYLTVIYGDVGWLHTFNMTLASWPLIVWTIFLLVYSYIASVIPVWTLLQPRDYINSLQLISALGLIVVGLIVASAIGGAPPVEGADRPALAMVAPAVNWNPPGAPAMVPFLFITIACGAISGFHCLVSSGTSSKQLKTETDARFVGYGSMLTEGFLATLVILACCAGIGMGLPLSGTTQVPTAPTSFSFRGADAVPYAMDARGDIFLADVFSTSGGGLHRIDQPRDAIQSQVVTDPPLPSVSAENPLQQVSVIGPAAYNTQYQSWQASGGLKNTVGAFVIGAANFVNAIGVPMGIAIALMGVLVASFAGTTMDTACRLQRYVIQELWATIFQSWKRDDAKLRRGFGGEEMHVRDARATADRADLDASASSTTSDSLAPSQLRVSLNPHVATLIAITLAGAIACIPMPGQTFSWQTAGGGGMILWPLFGATNQLLGGLAFMVIFFYLWRRNHMIWFLVLPMILMLVMPAWAMLRELPKWYTEQRYILVGIAGATIALEVWMIIEGLRMLPRVRGVIESIREREQQGFEVVLPNKDPA